MQNSYSSNSFDSSNILRLDPKFCPWDGYKFNENDNECMICGHSKYNIKVILLEINNN